MKSIVLAASLMCLFFSGAAFGFVVPKTTPGVLAIMMENFREAAGQHEFSEEIQRLFIRQQGDEAESQVDAFNNGAANLIARENEAAGEAHNLKVAEQSRPLQSACGVVTTSAAEAHSRQSRADQGARREEDRFSRITGVSAGKAFTDQVSPRNTRGIEQGQSIIDRVDYNNELADQAGPDGAVHPDDQMTLPQDVHRFLVVESIDDPEDMRAAREFVTIVAPEWLPDDEDLSVLQGDRGGERQTQLQRRVAVQMVPNSILHGVIDHFSRDAQTGMPSPIALRNQLVEEQYLSGNSFASRVATGDVISIYEVQRGDAVNRAYRVKDKLASFQSGLREEQMLATWLSQLVSPVTPQ